MKLGEIGGREGIEKNWKQLNKIKKVYIPREERKIHDKNKH